MQDSITRLKAWYKNNPDKLQIRSDNHRLWWEQNRDTADLSKPSTQNLEVVSYILIYCQYCTKIIMKNYYQVT